MTTADDTRPTGLGALADAREAVRVERRRVGDEREAFRAFRTRVGSIASEPIDAGDRRDASARGVAGGVDPERVRNASGYAGVADSGASVDTRAPAGSGLVAVRDAYVETVMSVPHYDVEYDDTYERSVREEFGPELCFALTRTSRFHAQYKRSLVDAVDAAIDERERFLDVIDTEAESVARAGSRLAAIDDEREAMVAEAHADADFGTLDACRARTSVLVSDVDRIAARRQRVIADAGRTLALDDDADVQAYLYQDLPVTYPVLAAVGDVGGRLDALRHSIERAASRR
ncbi:hypothetical protein [Halorubrum sp. BV1]|uniref:DUF7260 family protein n=1 Tax=Halorubrum sp. BV1 TaxID=1498500 RepID=UPI0006798106|nr:hypothetical protein [Halorubrum sp. BV1]